MSLSAVEQHQTLAARDRSDGTSLETAGPAAAVRAWKNCDFSRGHFQIFIPADATIPSSHSSTGFIDGHCRPPQILPHSPIPA